MHYCVILWKNDLNFIYFLFLVNQSLHCLLNMFHGISSLSLDSKGRVTVPVKYRPLLVPAGITYLAVVESDFGCLVMMPHNIWIEKTRILLKSGTETEKRFWIGLSDTPELDKSGRVLLTPMLRLGANINKEIIMLGVGENLEIWDAGRLLRHKEIVRAKNE